MFTNLYVAAYLAQAVVLPWSLAAQASRFSGVEQARQLLNHTL